MLKAEGLTKTYGKKTALEDLCLEVGAGEIVALLGANGAGKTTTIKLLLGLIRPSKGKAMAGGLPAGDPGVKGKIGYSPESPRFHEFLTVEETLRYYAELSGVPGGKLEKEVASAIERTGLDGVRKTKAGKLSKGEGQRLSLAQALLGDPPVLLLDEPTAGMDPAGRVAVRGLLEQWRAEGKTVLLNSHILSDVERICDRAVILRQGRLAWQGSLAEVAVRGDAVELRAEGWSEKAERVLAAEGYRAVRKEGLWLVTPCPPEEVHRLVTALVEAGVRIRALAPKGGTLEDLFLELNGGGNHAGNH